MKHANPPSSTPKALVVVDEPRIRTTLGLCLEGEGYATATAGSAREAVARERFDVAFLDLLLGVDSGLDLIGPFLEEQPRLQIVVITAHATVETAVEAMKRGAADYLPKPFTPAQVRLVAHKVAERRALETQVETLQERLKGTTPDVRLESQSPAMQQVFGLARQVAGGDTTVLIQGESGTGKGVLVRAIHAWSLRAEQPFSVVHCPSLSAELLESELFGHAKGAFTGAVQANAGRVARADGGTLFLDEIGDLPLALQPKLLRFVQDREYERVGDPTPRRADVRIVEATNQDLRAATWDGRFREDLFYRLNVIELEMPPLRERPEDVAPLAEQFLRFFAAKNGRRITGFTREAKAALRHHTWPGNVRELQNAVERAVILSRTDEIGPEHLPARAGVAAPAPQVGTMVTLSQLEEAHIRRVIAAAPTLDEAAETLGIDPATLWRKRKQYDL